MRKATAGKKEVARKCARCGKGVREGGVKAEGEGNERILCKGCVKAIYPEGKDLPVAMDRDGNVYFIDKSRNCVVLFFSYGEAPYSSCTEISLEEDECGCGFPLY